jgi:hypothetical protein
MTLKILCAGCSKDEREQAEAEVTRALAERSAGDAWTVSLVKLQGRWSVTLDAPAAKVRALTVAAPEGRLGDSIRQALRAVTPAPGAPTQAAPAQVAPGAPAPAAPSPRAPAPALPARTSSTQAMPTAARPASATPTPARPAAATPAPAGPAPAASPTRTPAAAGDGPVRCEKCRGAFVVQYDSRPGEPLQSVPVACPRCWHVNRVLIGAEAAFNRDYRAEKA